MKVSTSQKPAGEAAGAIFEGYAALAEWRYQIRKFLAFSEGAARAVRLQPQHHQALLAIKGLPKHLTPTLRVIAERLSIKPHTMVELADRLTARGLVRRLPPTPRSREVLLALTPKAERVLERLSVHHWRQLQTMAPALLKALGEIAPPGGRD